VSPEEPMIVAASGTIMTGAAILLKE